MAYLNWKKKPVSHEVHPHFRFEKELRVRLTPVEIEELAHELENVFAPESSVELRIDFQTEWTLFWRARDSESRLLVAHPEHQEWVATLALERGNGLELVRRLRQISAGDSITLSEIFPVAIVSNFELVVVRI